MTSPREAAIEAAAKVMCFHNGIAECFKGASPCTPETCRYGLRDFGETARAAIEAYERAMAQNTDKEDRQ